MHLGRIRLRTLLALLVLTTLIPLGLFAVLLIGRLWQQQRATVDRQNVEMARAISAAIDREVQSGQRALQVVAALDIFDEFVPARLNRLASRLMPERPGWYELLLTDAAGVVVFDTTERSQEAPPQIAGEWLRTALQTHQPAVSNLLHDPVAGGYFYIIAVPVVDSGTVKYVLAAMVHSGTLSEILRRQGAPPGGVVTLVDRTPVIMARTRNEQRFVGRPPSATFKVMSARMSEGSFKGTLLEGTPSYSSMSRSPVSGWTVGVGLPVAAVDAPILRSMVQLGLVAIMLIAAGIISALVIGRALVRALTSASVAARGLARGEVIETRRSRIFESQELSYGLLEAAAILNMRLRERDQALAAEYTARLEAEALSRSKDEFVAMMSHELRTPLNAIYGWVRLLRSGKLDPQRHDHALEVIERNTRAQTQLIEDLLDMSRILTGKLRLEMRRVDLATALQSAVEGLRPAAAAKEIEIVLDLKPGVAPISGDPDRLRQIFLNLLNNSLKFTSRSGRIAVTLETRGGDAVIVVADNGSGIAPELLPHIFERFRQGSSSPARKHGGLGIGLALVRHLVEMHGGTVVAASDGDGYGATFTISLPLMLDQRATDAADLPAAFDGAHALGETGEAKVLERLRVLVLEDNTDAREMITTTLKHAGAQVTAAASVQEALGVIDSAIPDVVVSDIAMPHGTGYDFLRWLRSMPRTADIPAIAVTAYTRSEDRDRALDEGFDAHLGKPVDPRELVRAVAAAAGRGGKLSELAS